MGKTFTKDPTEERIFSFDFSKEREILDDGETITGTPTVTATPAGLTISAVSISGNFVRCFIAGGTNGQEYDVSCTVDSSGGSTMKICGTLSVVTCG